MKKVSLRWLGWFVVLVSGFFPSAAVADVQGWTVDDPFVIYSVRIPASGTVEISNQETQWTTQIIVKFDEFPNFQTIDHNATQSFTASREQLLRFQVVNLPSNKQAFYTNVTSPNFAFEPYAQGWQSNSWDFSPAGGSIVTLKYKYVPTPPQPASSPLLACALGEGPYYGPFDRGFCSTQYCGNSPESWVRGRADVNKETGALAILMQLETDSVVGGPSGTVTVSLRDATGREIARGTSGSSYITGKLPGHSRIENASKLLQIPTGIASQVSTVAVQAHCGPPHDGLFGIFPGSPQITITIDFPNGLH